MFTFAYPAVFSRDEDGRWLVGFPDFPAAHTDGADLIEAMDEAIDCLGSSIAFAMADKADVPKPSRLKRGQKSVPVPLWIVAKLALYWAIRDLDMTQSELARRLMLYATPRAAAWRATPEAPGPVSRPGGRLPLHAALAPARCPRKQRFACFAWRRRRCATSSVTHRPGM